MDFHQFLIPRLEGSEIESNFDHYMGLVRKGIGGFIVFGGELEPVREGIRRLQAGLHYPLLIASDLEQGLGQQVKGGTLFPPAMAMAEAAEKDHTAVLQAFAQMAREAAYVGINAILAPVLDVNTNPDNPIICTRAFSERPDRVASLGIDMVRSIQSEGLMACGKHFPGHGSTDIDSHITLPVVSRSLKELEGLELVPFREAVTSGVEMLMTGHLSVPAIDPSGTPMTVSPKAMAYIRKDLGFNRIIITDAMNMGGISGQGSSPEYLALKAGADIVLHPDDPERAAMELASSDLRISAERLISFRKRLLAAPTDDRPDFDPTLCDRLTGLALKFDGTPRSLRRPYVITLTDETEPRGDVFISSVGAIGHHHYTRDASIALPGIPEGSDVVVAVFSEPRAWKADAARWLREMVRMLAPLSSIFIAFGNPYTLRELESQKDIAKAYAYWASPVAQRAMAQKLLSFSR